MSSRKVTVLFKCFFLKQLLPLFNVIEADGARADLGKLKNTVNSMAFDHPTFMLQFDHDSSQEDQSTHVTSHEHMSAKGQNKHDAQYSSLKSSETKYMNDVCTSSQVNDKAVSQTGSDSEQTCNVDEMICHISIPHSELTKYANYSEMLREQGQESKMVLLQYSQVFGDSEAYEQHASQAITDLTAHAQLLLETLNDQKKILCNRINNISDALKHEC